MSGQAWSRNNYNEWVYSKVRRFIVVRAGTNYCTGVPITTNNGQGAAKPGERKSDYCIVYSGAVPGLAPGEAPSFAGEAPMQPYPIQVDMDRLQKLDGLSRINFAAPKQVHYYFRVKNVGVVNQKSLVHLHTQYMLVTGATGPTSGPSTARTANIAVQGLGSQQQLSRPSTEAEKVHKQVVAQGHTPKEAMATLKKRQKKGSPDQYRGSTQKIVDEEDNNDEESQRRGHNQSSGAGSSRDK